MFWFILSLAASILTAFQLLPQTIHALRSDNLTAISLPTYTMILTTCILWLSYGLHLNDPAIIFANSLSLLCSMTIVTKKLLLKKNN